ncbi:hypothetical protein Hanom_Chr09g00775801 [Helianthus anomalus]
MEQKIESGVSLEAAPLFLRGRGKVVYILPSSGPTLALLFMRFTGYDDDDEIWNRKTIQQIRSKKRMGMSLAKSTM